MKCPQCGHEQSDGWLSCQKCHIIFSRWKPGATSAPSQPAAGAPATSSVTAPAPEPPRQASMYEDRPPAPTVFTETKAEVPTRRPAGWPVYLLLLLPFAAALWLLLNPKGRPVEPGSYRDEGNGFAIHAPDDWLTLTKDNFNAIMRQYGDQLPANLSRAMNSKGLAISFIRLGRLGEFAPTLNVVVVKSAPPPINEKSKLEGAKAIAEGFSALLPDYQQESVNIIQVDKIRSLEIISTASLPFRVPGAEDDTALPLRFHQVLVPGKKQAYILTFTASQDADEFTAGAFQSALDSFRVFKRPPRFGPVINGGLIGGLIGAIFFLLSGLLRSLGAGRES